MAPCTTIKNSKEKHEQQKRLTKDSTPYLGKKHNSGWDFKVLANLEVSCKQNRSSYNVVAPHGKLFFSWSKLRQKKNFHQMTGSTHI